jgi:hypothetical protein
MIPELSGSPGVLPQLTGLKIRTIISTDESQTVNPSSRSETIDEVAVKILVDEVMKKPEIKGRSLDWVAIDEYWDNFE